MPEASACSPPAWRSSRRPSRGQSTNGARKTRRTGAGSGARSGGSGAGGGARRRRAELPLDVADPRTVGLHDPARERVVQSQVARPVRHRCRGNVGGVELGGDLVDVVAQSGQPGDEHRVGHHVAEQHPRYSLMLDARKPSRLGRPLHERGTACVRERVLRPLTSAARALLGPQVAELLEPLGLGVVLAFCGRPVDPALSRHPDQIVGSGAVSADQRQHDVRERGEIRPVP